MNDRFKKGLSLKLQQSPDLVINGKEAIPAYPKRSYTRGPVSIAYPTLAELSPETNSVRSLNHPRSYPLSDVTSLTPTEILPSQCEKSSNPSVNYFFERAFTSSINHEYISAIKLYKKVIACESEHFGSWINTGICMMKLNMYSEAVTSFDNAMKSNKLSFVPYYNKALCYISIYDYPSALRCMDTAAELFPDPPEELQKIRTYAIFRSGKVSSAMSHTDGKDSPIPTKPLQSSFTPLEEERLEMPKANRRLTLSPVTNTLKKIEPGEGNLWNIKKVKDFDTRVVKTEALDGSSKGWQNLSSATPGIKARSKVKSYNWKSYMVNEFFKPKSKHSNRILELNIRQSVSKDQVIVKKLRDKMNSIEDKLIEFVVKKIQKSFRLPNDVGAAQLTEKEINTLIELYNNKQDSLQEIDDMLKNIESFSDIPEEFRKKLYEISEIKCFGKNDRVFTQGEAAHMFYLVFKGKLSSIIDTEKAEINSATEFLRYSRTLPFSDRPIIALEYLANCTAEKDSFLLSIPTNSYQIFLSDVLKSDIEDRVCFLINLPLFKGLDPITLIPLAWHLDKETFTEGETVLKKHEVPKGLIIIYSGYCGIYTTGLSSKSKNGSDFSNIKKRPKKPPGFYTGTAKSPELKPEVRIKGNMVRAAEKIEHGLLRYGDYFGGRMLMEQKMGEYGSKYSIIAESKYVEVLVISKHNMQYLQEKLVAHLKIMLQKSHDIDCPPDVDAEEMDYSFNQWQKYKSNIIDKIQRQKFLESKKLDFPYIR